MEFSFLPYSIVNNSDDPKDYDSPYSFISFIQYQNYKSKDTDDQLKKYQNYINNWAKTKKIKKEEEKILVRDTYVNLLREITLNFSTEEEKRFILNADFEDEFDLDIIIPFFIQKLKKICFFYNEKRQDVKQSVIRYNLKGSNFGIENIVKKIIQEYVENNLNTNKQELSGFYVNFDISIEELFSNSENYYDKSENSEFTYSNKIDHNIFLDIKKSIVESISAYPFYLKGNENNIIDNFKYNPKLTGSDLNLLKSRDFINYIENGEDNFKKNLFKSLYPKYISTDFYYLSTNSKKESVSGILFKSDDFNGQFLNKNNPTSITTQSLNELFSIYELGGFFVPQNQGILIYNTPKKTYKLDIDNISSDRVYVFPDPNKIGNTIYTSGEDRENVPLIYSIDVEWNRTKTSNGFKFNDILSDNYNQLFYGYESRQQDIKMSSEGMSKNYDNLTFWGGDKDVIWEGSFDDNIYPIDKDLDDLLLKEGVVVDWYCDENNNEFALYKKINSFSKNITSYNLNDNGIILDSETSFENRELNNVSLYDKKNVNGGKIFIRNNFYNKTENIKDAFSSIFIKYPSYVTEEIKDKCIKLFLIENVFVIETENYVISDSYNYDISTNKFKNTNAKPFYTKKKGFNKFLDTFINPWYDDKNKKMFLVFIKTLENSLSASNYKYITPEIYATDIKKIDYKKIYPNGNENYTNIYSLSTSFGDIPEINLVEYCGGSFRKNSFLNEYNFTYMAKNLNSMPFVINEKLHYEPENNVFNSETPILLKPFYYFLDNNYSNPQLQYSVRAKSNRSGFIGVKDDDSLNIVEFIPNKINYAFSSNVESLQLNEIGKYIIQFDWESYLDTNIFIGCSAINVKQVENNILINYNSNLYYLTAFNSIKKIFNFEKDGNIFEVVAERPTYPYHEILIFDVYCTNNSNFSGKFCENSIYKKIKVIKEGGGVGEIYTDPPCISCGEDCEYLYPSNTTLTLIASSSPKSQFSGWFGDVENEGMQSDLILNLSEDKTVIARFDPLPLYTVEVYSDIGQIISLDNNINFPNNNTSDYFLGTYVTLSASPAPYGFTFRRFSGAPCYAGDRLCTFIVYNDLYIKALYSEILYYDIRISIESDVFEYNPILINTIAGERELLIDENDEVSLLLTPLPQGTVKWEYAEENKTTYGTDVISLSEKTYISLTATPLNEYYVFSKWIGGPCDNSYNNICTFELEKNEDIIAYFDLVTYTVTIVLSGGGLGDIYSIPAGILTDPYSLNRSTTHEFVSGRVVTLYVNDLANSTYLGLCSYDVPSTHDTTITFKVTGNITLTAQFLPYEIYSLTLNKYGTNRIIFNSSPTPSLKADLSTTVASGEFVAGEYIDINKTPATPKDRILYYITDPVPNINTYYAGAGIVFSGTTYIDILQGNSTSLLLQNNSLIVTNPQLGAPYAESTLNDKPTGLKIEYGNIDINAITENRTISAFII